MTVKSPKPAELRWAVLECMCSAQGLKLVLYSTLLLLGLAVFMMSVFAAADARAESRIKDIVSVEGIRDNILVGYGLVVGLNGTGDKLNNSAFTEKSLEAFLARLGINTSDKDLKAKNVAAVTVTATLPAFSRSGSRIDVTVSTLGDAKSLQGGMLVATPLMGADGEVYAVAQGAVMIGGFEAKGESTTVSKGVPTNGLVPSGAMVEREVGFELNSMASMNLALRNPDIATAGRVAAAINKEIGAEAASVRDPGTVLLAVPENYRTDVAGLLGKVEQIAVQTDQPAKVIVDEASGTIVMNENVRVDTVAIAQGNLVVTVTEETQVSQPGAFAPKGAKTVTAKSTKVSVDEGEDNKMAIMNGGASLRDLVAGLNALGVGPRDLITILQTIKAAGALQAEIVAR